MERIIANFRVHYLNEKNRQETLDMDVVGSDTPAFTNSTMILLLILHIGLRIEIKALDTISDIRRQENYIRQLLLNGLLYIMERIIANFRVHYLNEMNRQKTLNIGVVGSDTPAFTNGAKIDDASHPAFIPTLFPRNSVKKRQTNRATLAGVFTPSPQTVSKSRRPTGPSETGRPIAPKKLEFCTEGVENAVWKGDHDYVLKQKRQEAEESVESLRQENLDIKSKQLRLENIKDKPEKFQFWTNLPNYEIFDALCKYLKSRIEGGNLCYWKGKATGKGTATKKRGPERKLTFEEELFIVLVKLKTGNFNEDLAHTFDISASHVSSIFSTHINFLSMELKALFEMQSSESDQAECFQSFNNLRVVLDCTELMVHRSSNLEARKKTFSNYKHYDSAKFLVGISPNLTVNYVSKAWGGRASDKHITLQSSGLMDGLSAGDSVMADRGFNVAGDFKRKGVKLLIPEFKGRDRAQITEKEASRSEYISKARIHVERIIQRIKTFYFLERTVRLNMHDIIEQIFTVCAYLTNFQMPIIRK